MVINNLISVIVPHYKVSGFEEDFLPQALDSLVRQTHKNFEVRVCLDCPEEDYAMKVIKIVENYREIGLKIFLCVRFDSEPSIPKTRNTAMVSAEGEWFAFLDSDNMLDPNWLEVMYKRAKEIFPKIPFSMAENLNDKTGERDIITGPEDNEIVYGKDAISIHVTRPLFGQMLVHRSHLEKIGFLFDNEVKVYETSLMVMKLLKHFRFTYVPHTKIITRVWGGTVSYRYKILKLDTGLWTKKAKEYWGEWG